MAFNDALLGLISPNIFEIFAVEHMDQSLRSALKYTIKVITDRVNPSMLCYANEVTLLAEGVLQAFVLWNYDGSMAETFYDLERVTFSGKSLKHYERWKSLATILLIPYVKAKFDDFNSELEYDDTIVTSNRRDFKSIFLKVFPYVIATLNAIKVCIHLRYLFKASQTHSLVLFLIGVTLNRHRPHLLQDNVRPTSVISRLYQTMLSYLLPVILFGFKFIEWWYSPEKEAATHGITKLPVPHPPSLKHYSAAPSNDLLCPICHKLRKNSTCIASSGFVYCYSCIYESLKHWKKCPVSSILADHSMLIRLFPHLLD